MNRRGFLSSILALGAAPAIVRADSLMRIVPREAGLVCIHADGGVMTLAPAEITNIVTFEDYWIAMRERLIEKGCLA